LELANGHIRIGEKYVLASSDYVPPSPSRKGFLHATLGSGQNPPSSKILLKATLRIFNDAELEKTAPMMLRVYRNNPQCQYISGSEFVLGVAVLRPQIDEYLPEVQFGVWLPSKSYEFLFDRISARNFPTAVDLDPKTSDPKGSVGFSYGGGADRGMDWVLETSEGTPSYFFLQEFSMHFESGASQT
jgi:hypothetical protein